ncbi:MAG: hypothetical protein ACWA41_05725 [Putridiphycobacter sp.]
MTMLKDFPDQSKVFVFQSNKIISEEGIGVVKEKMDAFVPEWTVHGKNLKATYQFVSPLFIIVAVDESLAELSGCSKDSLTKAIKEIGELLDVDFFDRMSIAYHPNDTDLAIISLAEFKKLMQSDDITGETIVYNNLIETLGDLKQNWQIPVKNSWHQNLVPAI